MAVRCKCMLSSNEVWREQEDRKVWRKYVSCVGRCGICKLMGSVQLECGVSHGTVWPGESASVVLPPKSTE